MTAPLHYLPDGVYREVRRGPAVCFVTRTETDKKGKPKEVTRAEETATWVHLEKIGPPVHDRGSRDARPKPRLSRDPFEEVEDERF